MSRTLKLCIGGSTRRVNLFWSWWLTFKIDFEKKIQSLCGIWYYVLNKSPIILMTFGKTSNDEAQYVNDKTWFLMEAPLVEQSFFPKKISAAYHKLSSVWITSPAILKLFPTCFSVADFNNSFNFITRLWYLSFVKKNKMKSQCLLIVSYCLYGPAAKGRSQEPHFALQGRSFNTGSEVRSFK